MGKKLFVTIFIATFAVALIVAINTGGKSSPSSDKQRSAQSSNTESSTGNGRYIGYTPETIQATTGDKVLFFHAPWCRQCNSIEAGIQQGQIPSGLTVIKVDYDSHQELRRKYGVTIQTTFVKVDNQGNLIDKYIAYDEPTFDAVKRNFL